MRVRVKICGLTNARDAEFAASCGADCLGFVLYPKSPRALDLESLARVVASLPGYVARVGVVVNADGAFIAEAVEAGGLSVVQFHGDETPAEVSAFTAASAWKAVPLENRDDLRDALGFPAECLVADAASAQRGGSGLHCDWELAAKLAYRRPVVLAGGLTPENVAEAIRRVRPFAVDVSSGVEIEPGKKDPDRVRAFIDNALAASEKGKGR